MESKEERKESIQRRLQAAMEIKATEIVKIYQEQLKELEEDDE